MMCVSSITDRQIGHSRCVTIELSFKMTSSGVIIVQYLFGFYMWGCTICWLDLTAMNKNRFIHESTLMNITFLSDFEKGEKFSMLKNGRVVMVYYVI